MQEVESSLCLRKPPGGNPGCLLNFKTPARAPILSDNYGRWDRGAAFHPNIFSSVPCELWLPGSVEYVMDSDVGA